MESIPSRLRNKNSSRGDAETRRVFHSLQAGREPKLFRAGFAEKNILNLRVSASPREQLRALQARSFA
jgi:hypothetical protein